MLFGSQTLPPLAFPHVPSVDNAEFACLILSDDDALQGAKGSEVAAHLQ